MATRRTEKPRWAAAHWWVLGLMLVPALALTVGRVHELPTAEFLARHVSLAHTQSGLHTAIGDLLFVPIGALVVVLFRLTLGVRLLGPFRSILLAFAFLETGVWLGLLFLAATVAVIVIARPAIKALRLPYFGRVSVMLSAVALLIVVGTLLGIWLQSSALGNVAHFPIVVLVLVGEKVGVTIRREGVASGVWRTAATALVAVVVTVIAGIPGIGELLRVRPELMLVEMAAIVVVASLCNWRLLTRRSREPVRRGPVELATTRPRA